MGELSLINFTSGSSVYYSDVRTGNHESTLCHNPSKWFPSFWVNSPSNCLHTSTLHTGCGINQSFKSTQGKGWWCLKWDASFWPDFFFFSPRSTEHLRLPFIWLDLRLFSASKNVCLYYLTFSFQELRHPNLWPFFENLGPTDKMVTRLFYKDSLCTFVVWKRDLGWINDDYLILWFLKHVDTLPLCPIF